MVRIEVNARHRFSDEDRHFLQRFFRPDFLPDTGVNCDETEWSICFWVEFSEDLEQICSDTVHFIASRVRIWERNADGSLTLLAKFEN